MTNKRARLAKQKRSEVKRAKRVARRNERDTIAMLLDATWDKELQVMVKSEPGEPQLVPGIIPNLKYTFFQRDGSQITHPDITAKLEAAFENREWRRVRSNTDKSFSAGIINAAMIQKMQKDLEAKAWQLQNDTMSNTMGDTIRINRRLDIKDRPPEPNHAQDAMRYMLTTGQDMRIVQPEHLTGIDWGKIT